MLKAFESYIEKNQLRSKDSPTLIGVSGGRDSVVLCELYHRAKLPFAMAHCNFNLRGDESDDDEAFVVNLAQSYGVILHRKSCDTEAYAGENNISIQMAARELRFSWFEELCQENNYQYYATAHHSDDAIETYLINQIRGTGLSGLHGILAKNGKLIHPLLFASRSDIDIFIEKHQLKYRDDSSNASIKYMRNKIRHQLIPILEEINPQIKETFLANMQKFRASEEIIKFVAQEFTKNHTFLENEEWHIHIDALKKNNFATDLLFELIKDYGFHYSQAKKSLSEDTQSGALFYSKNHVLLHDREELILRKNQNASNEQYIIHKETKSINNPLSLQFNISFDTNIIKEPNVAQLDYEKLSFPLYIRKWEQGDFFYPIGMKGRKKLLSDFFIDQKLSLFEKENIWLLCSQEDIVWIIGHRIDERYKLQETTRQVFQIKLASIN